MTLRNDKRLFGATLLWAASMALQAQPAGQDLLDGVRAYVHDGLLHIEVQLSRPFRYLGSCPQQATPSVCLRLAAPNREEGGAEPWRGRERMAVRAGHGLLWVEYDGEAEGGPLLYLQFDRAVAYRVLPDAGHRRFLIAVMPTP